MTLVSRACHHFTTYIVVKRDICVNDTRFGVDGPLHWNVWRHQMSFEISFMPPIGILFFLFSFYPVGSMKLISNDMLTPHIQCNWVLRTALWLKCQFSGNLQLKFFCPKKLSLCRVVAWVLLCVKKWEKSLYFMDLTKYGHTTQCHIQSLGVTFNSI